MCGIAGIASWNRDNHIDQVQNMLDQMKHRGPDGGNIKQLEGICLGHRRLSIVDLTNNGSQPMRDGEGRFTISFNGEIYGFNGLRNELKRSGYNFNSKSDTEVILAGVVEWGIKVLCEKISGMFAFALWDNKLKKLFLCRDRFGEKPLYYIKEGTKVTFSSNANTLFFKRRPALNKSGVLSFLNQGFCSPNTPIYENLLSVKPGHILEVGEESIMTYPYYELKPNSLLFNEKDWLSDLDSTLQQVIEDELVSDVGCGALLSGGVDSSLIAKYALGINPETVLYTVRMSDNRLDESSIASDYAKHLGANHKIVDGRPISKDEYIRLIQQFSEPLGDSSAIGMYIVSKAVKEQATVLLTGDGGDEMFAGYNSIKLAADLKTARSITSNLGLSGFFSGVSDVIPVKTQINVLKKAKTYLDAISKNEIEFKITRTHFHDRNNLGLLGEIFNERPQKLEYQDYLKAIAKKNNYSAIEKMLLIDIYNNLLCDYIPKVDVSTMANSIEARSPFLHHKIADLAFSMPLDIRRFGNRSKGALKELLSIKVDHPSVKRIIKGKRGFVIPVDNWLDGEWNDLVAGLSNSALIDMKILTTEGINNLNKAYSSSPQVFSRLRYNLVVLNIWYSQWF